MRLSTIEYDFVCKTREHGLFRQKNMFYLLRQKNIRTCFYLDRRTCFLLRQENMRTRGPFPVPLSATRFANILHISFQLLSRYINSAPLTCAPRIGKALGRWAGACLLRLARAKVPRFRVRDRVLASSER